MKELPRLQPVKKPTKDQIISAYRAGKARIVWETSEGRPVLLGLRLDGYDYDTRGGRFWYWGESWTTKPESLKQCFDAAAV